MLICAIEILNIIIIILFDIVGGYNSLSPQSPPYVFLKKQTNKYFNKLNLVWDLTVLIRIWK